MVRRFLTEHGAAVLVDAAESTLSEVVTNAVLHARTPLAVSLALEGDGALRAAVTDRSRELPSQREFSSHATT